MTRIDLLATALGRLASERLTTMDGAILCALMRFSNARRGQLQRIIRQPMHATSMQNLVTRGFVTSHRPPSDLRRYALSPKGVTLAHNLLGMEEPTAA
jgi:DNA-binding HxlR family transcriptional regulator